MIYYFVHKNSFVVVHNITSSVQIDYQK